jgi:hypothetical protein
MPLLLRRVHPTLVIAPAGPDEHGYFSWTQRRLRGRPHRTSAVLPGGDRRSAVQYGENQIHIGELAGWIRSDAGFPAISRRPAAPRDEAIAGHIADMISDGVCLRQA